MPPVAINRRSAKSIEQPRHRDGVDNAADREAADHHAGDRGAGDAFGLQQRRHVGKHAEHEYRFQEHGAEAVFRQRIAEHRAIVRNEAREIEAAGRLAHAAEARDRECERDQIDGAGGRRTRRASRSSRRSRRRPRRPGDCRSWLRTAACRTRPGAAPPARGRRPTRTRSGRRRRRSSRRARAGPSAFRNSCASPQASVVMPPMSMHTAISRALLNMSASAPSTGCTSA